jgi:hypothetical protein
MLNNIKAHPFVTSINSVQALSTVEGLRQSFSEPVSLGIIPRNGAKDTEGKLERSFLDDE